MDFAPQKLSIMLLRQRNSIHDCCTASSVTSRFKRNDNKKRDKRTIAVCMSRLTEKKMNVNAVLCSLMLLW